MNPTLSYSSWSDNRRVAYERRRGESQAQCRRRLKNAAPTLSGVFRAHRAERRRYRYFP